MHYPLPSRFWPDLLMRPLGTPKYLRDKLRQVTNRSIQFSIRSGDAELRFKRKNYSKD
jgi:hypothetical protein